MRATFPNPEDSLIQGDFGRVILYSKSKDSVPVVPQIATMENQEGRYVYILDKDNKPKMSYIKTMGEIDGKWIVTSGVQKGDRIITGGLQKVIPGNPVRIVASVEQTKEAPKNESLVNKIGKKFYKIFKK